MKDATLGGYLETHRRPPAFTGSDGHAYSAEIYADERPCDNGLFGAAMIFVRWSREGDRPIGHLETEYLAYAATPAAASARLKELSLHQLKQRLDRLIEKARESEDW